MASNKVNISVYKKLKAEMVNGKYDKNKSEVISENAVITVDYAEKVNAKFNETGVYFEPIEKKKKSKRDK